MSDIRFKPWVGDKYAIGIVGYDATVKLYMVQKTI